MRRYRVGMQYEWDEAKRHANLAKHGVDFLVMRALFDGRPELTETNSRFGDTRDVTTGELNGRFYTVVWTKRGDVVRLISARRARDEEERAYRAVHGG